MPTLNTTDIILIILIVAAVTVAVIHVVRQKKKGGCSCGCGGCAMRDICEKKEKKGA